MSRKENYRRLGLWQTLVVWPWATLWAVLGWLLVAGVMGVSYQGWQALHAPGVLPPMQWVLQSELHRQPRAELEQSMQRWLQATHFLSLDIYALRAQLEGLPWIAQAEVRKRWPDRVEVKIQEWIPYARWGDAELVTAAGVRFQPPAAQIPPGLPQLIGPDGYERRLIQQYQALTQRFKAVGLELTSLQLDQRLSWQIVLTTGTEVRLGKTHVGPRLQRFLAYYAQPQFVGQAVRMARVDLRYPNGFAIAWRDPTQEAEHGAPRT